MTDCVEKRVDPGPVDCVDQHPEEGTPPKQDSFETAAQTTESEQGSDEGAESVGDGSGPLSSSAPTSETNNNEAVSPPDECDSGTEVAGPFTEDALRAIDVNQIGALVEALTSFRTSAGTHNMNSSEMTDLAWACCVTLVIGPQELGTAIADSALRDHTLRLLSKAEASVFPEADVCALWLNCATEDGEEDVSARFADLAAGSLWLPIAALAWRALAHFGARERLASFISREDDLSLYEADAWMEASLPGDCMTDPVGRVNATKGFAFPQKIVECQLKLLHQESALACKGVEYASEATLMQIVKEAPDCSPRDYSEAVALRLAVRAVAALVRFRIGVKRGDEGLLSRFPADHLPAWEHAYLKGLVSWRLGDTEAAKTALNQSQDLNPYQSCVHLALAALPGACSLDDTLEWFGDSCVSRELQHARSAVLARLVRYDESEAALQRAAADGCAREPMRFTWAEATTDRQFREEALRAALAERRGDWATADKVWRLAGKDKGDRSLAVTRHLFAATREMETATAGSPSRRIERVRRERDRLRHQIGLRPLIGNETFFRGFALMEELPGQAERDLRSLLYRHSWVQTEKRVGGGRLVPLGDALSRLGCMQDAIRAYAHAIEAGESAAAVRLALLNVCEAAGNTADAGNVAAQAETAADLVPDSPWPFVLGAVRLLVNGQAEVAGRMLEKARGAGASEPLCECIGAAVEVMAGESSSVPKATLRALRMSSRTTAILSMLLMDGEIAPRLQAFMAAVDEDWVSHCPVDIETTAANHLAELCDEGEWTEAERFIASLVASGVETAKELKSCLDVRHALALALQGALTEAEKRLASASS